jgi:cytochrome b involved in lipid metabolism
MHWVLEFVCSFVFEYYVEIGSLLLLTLITIFRRELSINDEYRLSKHDDDGSNSIGHSADPAYYQINGTAMEDSSEMSMANEGDEIALLEEENENSQIGMSHATESNTSDEDNTNVDADNNDTTIGTNLNTSDTMNTSNTDATEQETSPHDTLFKVPSITSINIHSIPNINMHRIPNIASINMNMHSIPNINITSINSSFNQLMPDGLSNITNNFSALAMKMPFLNRDITSRFDLRSLFCLARRRDRMSREIRLQEQEQETTDDLAMNDSLSSNSNINNNNDKHNNEHSEESPFYKLRVENLLHVVEFLLHTDISALSSTSYQLYTDCRSDFIWRNIWIQNFGEMWTCDKINAIRQRRGITWNPLGSKIALSTSMKCCEKEKPPSLTRQYSGGSIDSTIYRNHDDNNNNNNNNNEDMAPVQGWYMFYLEFEACWIDWLLAGESNEKSCFVGICGSIYDLTPFLPYHPGSMETLAESCGGDGTDNFIDVGHSQHAVEISRDFLVWSPYQLTFAKNKSSEQQSNVRKMLGHYKMNSYRQKIITKFHAILRREKHVVEKYMARENVRHSIMRRDIHYAQQEKALQLLSGVENHILAIGSGNNFSEHFFSGDDSDSDDSDASSQEQQNKEETEKEEIIGNVGKDSECVCTDGTAHRGRVRGMYDPLAQKWCCWWTCCSQFTLELPLDCLNQGILDSATETEEEVHNKT